MQTAIPGKRLQRRQIIGKNQNASGNKGGLINNIEQGKYVTISDRYKDQQAAVELAQALAAP